MTAAERAELLKRLLAERFGELKDLERERRRPR